MKLSSKLINLKNGKQVELRSAREQDSKAMLDHLVITHTESYKNLNQSADFWKNMSVADEQKTLADFENSKSKFMLIAVYETRIIAGLGFVGYQAEFTKRAGQLGMSVQQAFANSGLGTELMRHAIELARQLGFHKIDLSVRTYNGPGISLYEKSGFKRIGLVKDAAFIEGKYVDEYAYQLILD